MVKMIDLTGRKYVIEDDIPIPTSRSLENEELYAAVRQMKVGQSVLIPAQRTGMKSNLERATGFKFTQRTFSRGPNAGKMRIWRTA